MYLLEFRLCSSQQLPCLYGLSQVDGSPAHLQASLDMGKQVRSAVTFSVTAFSAILVLMNHKSKISTSPRYPPGPIWRFSLCFDIDAYTALWQKIIRLEECPANILNVLFSTILMVFLKGSHLILVKIGE